MYDFSDNLPWTSTFLVLMRVGPWQPPGHTARHQINGGPRQSTSVRYRKLNGAKRRCGGEDGGGAGECLTTSEQVAIVVSSSTKIVRWFKDYGIGAGTTSRIAWSSYLPLGSWAYLIHGDEHTHMRKLRCL